MSVHGLVVAKAPVAGLAKTRLGAAVGVSAAADLAAAALLDTLDACREAFEECHLALEGDLAQAARSAEITRALAGWHVFAQVGDGLGARLAHAHRTVAARGAAVVQVGMDTPQVRATDLRAVADLLDDGATTVLGPAEDGGWWVLGLADGTRAELLREVPTSRPDTFELTLRTFTADGSRVALASRQRDVDTAADADAVAATAPASRFARAWATHLQAAS